METPTWELLSRSDLQVSYLICMKVGQGETNHSHTEIMHPTTKKPRRCMQQPSYSWPYPIIITDVLQGSKSYIITVPNATAYRCVMSHLISYKTLTST